MFFFFNGQLIEKKNFMQNVLFRRIVYVCICTVFLGFMISCQGPAGPAGTDGNANVKFISFTLAARDWQQGTGADRSLFVHTRNVPEITTEVANGGAVLVYQSSDGQLWRALSFSQVYS
jgi:hypothetical protein